MRIYLQGLTMGLAYVAPIGLQNLFVINSALTQRRSRVYLTALIVILWDVSLGVSCFLGAGALMQALPWLQKVILGIGSPRTRAGAAPPAVWDSPLCAVMSWLLPPCDTITIFLEMFIYFANGTDRPLFYDSGSKTNGGIFHGKANETGYSLSPPQAETGRADSSHPVRRRET